MSRKSKALQFVNEGYNITITGRNVQVTDFMKDYALEQVSKIERFTQRIIDINIIMDIQRLDHRAEIIAKVDHTTLTSQAISNNMYVSIDKAIDKLKAQLLRYKAKIQDHHPKESIGGASRRARAPAEEEEPGLEEEETFTATRPIDEYRLPKISKREKIPLRTLTEEEALLKLDFSGNAFLIYKDEANQKIHILYPLGEGEYAIIEPEIHE